MSNQNPDRLSDSDETQPVHLHLRPDTSLPDALETIGALAAERARLLESCDEDAELDSFEDRIGAAADAGLFDPRAAIGAVVGLVEMICVAASGDLAEFFEEATKHVAEVMREEPPMRRVCDDLPSYIDLREGADRGSDFDDGVEHVQFSLPLVHRLGALIANLEVRPYFSCAGADEAAPFEAWTTSAAVSAYLHEVSDADRENFAALVALPIVLLTEALSWLDRRVIAGLSRSVVEALRTEVIPQMLLRVASPDAATLDDLGEAA